MAKNQNTVEKRRREMEKKRKAEEKRERRRKKKEQIANGTYEEELTDEQLPSQSPQSDAESAPGIGG
ncbi:MAG: hypothetical protein VX988_10500 [Planctomycetota bacterium]|nr:hypothetical protein [Planctomycetota bacterium]